MTPKERQEFEDMKRRLQAVETASNVDFVGSVTDRIITNKQTVSDIEVTNTVGAGGGSTFDFPDQWLVIEYKGAIYRIPGYYYNR